MSIFSGKCDLYDHMMMEKTYDKGGCYTSDELECFEIFKRKTHGVIHQHQKITVSEWNQSYVKEHCPAFDYKEITTTVFDKRCKNGSKEVKSYEYYYYMNKYSLKDLNKHGVYITIDIPFNTLLDLIPYYPYVVAMACCDQDTETVYIAHEPWPMDEFHDSMRTGGCMPFPAHYQAALQRHTLEVCHEYFLKDIDIRTKTIPLFNYKPLHNGYYELLLPESADYMHKPQFIWKDGKIHTHWTSPKISDCEDYVILISEQDIDGCLADDIKHGNVSIQYVAKCKFPNTAHSE